MESSSHRFEPAKSSSMPLGGLVKSHSSSPRKSPLKSFIESNRAKSRIDNGQAISPDRIRAVDDAFASTINSMSLKHVSLKNELNDLSEKVIALANHHTSIQRNVIAIADAAETSSHEMRQKLSELEVQHQSQKRKFEKIDELMQDMGADVEYHRDEILKLNRLVDGLKKGVETLEINQAKRAKVYDTSIGRGTVAISALIGATAAIATAAGIIFGTDI